MGRARKGNLWQPWTQNLYAYVGNNPVNWIDPTGHSTRDPNEGPDPIADVADKRARDADRAKRSGSEPPPNIDEDAYRAATTAQEKLKILEPLFRWAESMTGVPWEVQAAQWGLESAWGAKVPRERKDGSNRYSYNLFGLKVGAHGEEGTAGFVWDYGSEQDANGNDTGQELMKWRAYRSYGESILDHADVLTNEYWKPVRDACGLNIGCWAHELAPESRGGHEYATDVDYETNLLNVVQTVRRWSR